MGRRCNGEARGRALSLRCLRGLDGSSKGTNLGASHGFLVDWGALTAVLLACLDDLPLPFSYIQTALELRAHGRVLSMEARGKAGEAHVHDVGAAGPRGPGSECTRGVDNIVVGEVQAARAVTCGGGGHVRRGRLLLDDYPGGGRAA